MTRAPRGVIAVFLLLLPIATAVAALAPPGPSPGPSCDDPRHVPHLGPACPLADGHFEVLLSDGTVLVTHGPDPPPPAGDVGFGAGDEERAPVCAPTPRMHVLYGYPSTAADRLAEVADDLRAAVRRMNAVLNADALASGGVTADYRVACDGDGEIAIDPFPGPDTGGEAYTVDFAAVVDAARSAGFDRARTDYLIFYDDRSDGVCGVGNFHRDDRLAKDNANLAGPDYGVAYDPCWYGRAPMHENGHNQGAVQVMAPKSDLLAHCLDGLDVMCYTSSLAGLILCTDRVHYDCDDDTYFDVDPEDGEWLADHWNIGSRLNGYLAFGDEPPPSAEAPRPDLAVAPDRSEVTARPGSTLREDVRLSNNGTSAAEYTLSVADVPDGWHAAFDGDDGRLDGGASRVHTMEVRVANATPGRMEQLRLRVHHGGEVVDEATLTVRVAEPAGALTLASNASLARVAPGADARFSLTATNGGSTNLTVTVEVRGLWPNASVAIEPATARLAPGETLQSEVTVATPANLDGAWTFEALASASEGANASVTLEIAPGPPRADGLVDPTGTTVPGPAAVGVVVALAAATLLARRRGRFR